MSRLALIALAVLLGAAPAYAANADNPDRNVDKSNDRGGDTGDSKVDTLNKGQLDENQKPAGSGQSGSQPTGTAQPQPASPPPPQGTPSR